MMKFIIFLLLPILAFAQTSNVQKTISSNRITAGFKVPSGITIEFESGATFQFDAGAIGGFLTDPTTTAGDTIFKNGSGLLARLPIGTSGQVLTVAGGVPIWSTPYLSPLTTKGDVLTFGTVPARLPVGTDGQFITADSTQTLGLKWSTGLANPMTTKADLIVGGASGAATRLAVGSDGQALLADSTQTLGVKWGTVSGSGTVNSGTATQVAYYASTGTAVSSSSQFTVGSSGNPGVTAGGSNQNITLTPSGTGLITSPSNALFNTVNSDAKMLLGYQFSSPSYYPGFWVGTATTAPDFTNYSFLSSSIGESFFNAWSTRFIDFQIGGTTKVRLSSAGNILIGTTSDDASNKLQVNGTIKIGTHTPSSSSDTGITGTVTWDASFIYVCTATNTWKRVAIATW